MTTLIGQEFGGYRIISQVGKGGMATVYKAFQASLDRYVAIKVMPPFYAQEDETFLKRFKREARSVAKLRHPNILMVIDFGEHGGFTYIVMEYVDAGTLTDRLGSPMPLNDIATIIDQVAGALDYAHGQGVVHRDVKPSNILLPKPNWPLLTDFGLAKIVGASQLTITGSIAGTPAYMSPEQGQGEAVDARSDIYSLGIVLYEMATGSVPYHAETPMAVVVKHIIEPLPLPRSKNPGIPEDVERVILKALAKKPGDRYQRVADLSNALMRACERSGAPTMVQETVVEPRIQPERKPEIRPEIPDLEKGRPSPTEPLPEEAKIEPPPTSPEPQLRMGIGKLFEGRKWLRWAIPVGLVGSFLCMIGFAAIIFSNLQDGNGGQEPPPTVTIEAVTAAKHIEQGYAFYDEENFEAAAREFETAIDQGSEDVEMYFDLADIYFFELNKGDEAVATIERVLSFASDDPYVLETSGVFFQIFGQHEEAIYLFERVLELEPSAQYLYLDMAESYEALGEFEKAEELRHMTESEQKDENANDIEAQGWEQFSTGDYQAAIESFSHAVELDPSLLNAWDGLSEAYWYMGDTSSAISVLQSALEFEFNQPESWVYEKIGWFYWDLLDYENAVSWYERAIEVDPLWSTAYIPLSDLYFEQGDYDLAFSSLERGIATNPNRSDIHERLGYLYLNAGDIQNAMMSFERATEIDPLGGWSHFGLAQAYYEAGRYDEAGVALDNAAANSFEDPWLEDSIGWMYLDFGRCDLAVPHFELALKLDSSILDAQDGIDFCSE